jgi:hypothetical protein
MWKTIYIPPAIAMVAIAQFSQKMDSCCLANDRFSCVVTNQQPLLGTFRKSFAETRKSKSILDVDQILTSKFDHQCCSYLRQQSSKLKQNNTLCVNVCVI